MNHIMYRVSKISVSKLKTWSDTRLFFEIDERKLAKKEGKI